MKRLTALPFALALGLSTPALADLSDTVEGHILPGLSGFATAAETLAETAAQDCRATAIRVPFQATFDAWMRIADLRLGPSETAALSIAFWPDSRGATQRTLTRMIAEEDPVAHDTAAYGDVSIAARGLFALDMLIYDPAFDEYAQDSYTCALVATIAADLAAQADALRAAWQSGFAETLLSAGAEGNATYLAPEEAIRALYTQILFSLEFTADTRLGQPMGSFERPRPARAEARRAGRSLRNVVLAAEAARSLASALADHAVPQSDAALADIRAAASRIADPAFADIADPQARLRVEVLQQAVRALKTAIEVEIGAPLDIAPGFNSQDGD